MLESCICVFGREIGFEDGFVDGEAFVARLLAGVKSSRWRFITGERFGEAAGVFDAFITTHM